MSVGWQMRRTLCKLTHALELPGSILKKSNSLQHWRNANQNKPPLPNWRSTNFLIPEASAEELEEESHGGGAGRGAGEGNEAGLNESRAHSSLSLRPLRAVRAVLCCVWACGCAVLCLGMLRGT
eukprot:1177267-Rhodomonas_salina.2